MECKLSGIYLKIAEWLLEQGRAVSDYEISQRFEITTHQARGFIMNLKNDTAIQSQRETIPTNSPVVLNKSHVRTIMITAIDREKIALRNDPDRGNIYQRHQVKSVSYLGPEDKWQWILRHARRRKR
ncbi:TPA: hypothetical protein ACIBE2_001101 [Salmonella enterica subsp. diarizonae serovar 61:r:-]